MIDITVFLVLGVLFIPLGLLSVSTINVLKYYPIILVLLAKYLTKLELKYNDKPLFGDLYQTNPKTSIQMFSTVVINLFALVVILLLSFRITLNISTGEKFIVGLIYFIALYCLANQGVDYIYDKTDNNHLLGGGYVVVVATTLCILLYFIELGNFSKVNFYNNRNIRNNINKRNNQRVRFSSNVSVTNVNNISA